MVLGRMVLTRSVKAISARLVGLLAAFAVLVGMSTPAAAQAAYDFCPAGSTIFNVVNGPAIWSYDPATDVDSLVAPVSVPVAGLPAGANLNGLMLDRPNNRLLFVSRPTATTTQLWAYDPDHPTSPGWYAAAPAFTSEDFPRAGMTSDGVGYLMAGNNATPQVWRVTSNGPYTYAVSLLGTMTYDVAPTNNSSGDIAFDGNGVAWLSAGEDLYSVDLDGGSLTAVRQAKPLLGGVASTISWAGVAFADDGRLFVANNGASGAYYAYDFATGVLTLQEATGADSARDLTSCAFPTPAEPDLSVVKTLAEINGVPAGAGATVEPGNTLAYDITVSNSGGAAGTLFARDVVETLPSGTTFIAAGSDFSLFAGNYSNTAPANVPAGGSVVLRFNVQIDNPLNPAVSAIQNSVSIPVINCASPPNVCATSTPIRGLTLDKTGTLNDLNGNGVLDLGETIDYQFEVENVGTTTLTGVTVNDPLPVAVNEGPQTLAPGATFIFTGSYTPNQANIDAGSVTNTATATGTPPVGAALISPPDSVTILVAPSPLLELVKTGTFDDPNGNGAPDAGETITYSFAVTNAGNVTITGVAPVDAGPTFNGRPATNALSAFSPPPADLAPTQSRTFTATYVLDEADIRNAAGLAGSVSNSAQAAGVTPAGPVTSATSLVALSVPALLSVSKRAEIRQVLRGGFVPYTIVVTNGAAAAATDLDVTDTIPSGFRFVDGSATVGGVAATPIVAGRDVLFENLAVGAGASLEITLQLQALPTTGPGTYVNIVVVEDAAGAPITTAEAAVEIEPEAVFDCAELLGRVFDDENGNGFQNDGELGLPGVRLATVNGELITTDEHGRFSVPCAALPNAQIGSNFVLKLDERTLPTGYSLTTPNPEAIRLTAGKMSRINFGASIGRLVDVELSDTAFIVGSTEPVEELSAGIEQLVQPLASERSVVRLTYRLGEGDRSLVTERLRRLERLIEEQWRRAGSPYELAIDSRTVQSE
jgi:uncharacterized repeat protein (TIGR01451 family)